MRHDEWLIKENITQLRQLMSDQNLQLLPDYEQRIAVLKDLGFIDDKCRVELKGKVACEVSILGALHISLTFSRQQQCADHVSRSTAPTNSSLPSSSWKTSCLPTRPPRSPRCSLPSSFSKRPIPNRPLPLPSRPAETPSSTSQSGSIII